MCSSSHVSSLKYPPRNTASLFSAPPLSVHHQRDFIFPLSRRVTRYDKALSSLFLSLSLPLFRSSLFPHFLQQHHSLFLLSQYYTNTHSLSLFPTPYSCYFHVCIYTHAHTLSRPLSLLPFCVCPPRLDLNLLQTLCALKCCWILYHSLLLDFETDMEEGEEEEEEDGVVEQRMGG